jgi:hypothetical protein
MKVQRGLSPASVNQALAGMDNLFRFLGLGAAIVRREELPRARRARWTTQRRLLLQAADESTRQPRSVARKVTAVMACERLEFLASLRLPIALRIHGGKSAAPSG